MVFFCFVFYVRNALHDSDSDFSPTLTFLFLSYPQLLAVSPFFLPFSWRPSRPKASLALPLRTPTRRRLPASRPPCASAAPPAPALRRDRPRRRGARPPSPRRPLPPAGAAMSAPPLLPLRKQLPPLSPPTAATPTPSSTSTRPSTLLPSPFPRKPRWGPSRNTRGCGKSPSTTPRRFGAIWPRRTFSGRRNGTTSSPGEFLVFPVSVLFFFSTREASARGVFLLWYLRSAIWGKRGARRRLCSSVSSFRALLRWQARRR